jgi:hypothetical protein
MSQPVVAGVQASATNWAAIAALAAWATVAIYIILGLFAWRQVREARKLREEQARPFVIVDFELAEADRARLSATFRQRSAAPAAASGAFFVLLSAS